MSYNRTIAQSCTFRLSDNMCISSASSSSSPASYCRKYPALKTANTTTDVYTYVRSWVRSEINMQWRNFCRLADKLKFVLERIVYKQLRCKFLLHASLYSKLCTNIYA